MWTKRLMVLAVMVLAAGCNASAPKNASNDTKGVEEATGKFYASLNAMFKGDAAPMQAVWSHANDVTYMGPGGGILTGWDEIRAIWESQAALKLGGKIEPAETRVNIGDNLAIVQCYERGDNVDAEGQPVQVSIRATNVFRKENGQWKMIGHHTDLLPFLEKLSLTSAGK